MQIMNPMKFMPNGISPCLIPNIIPKHNNNAKGKKHPQIGNAHLHHSRYVLLDSSKHKTLFVQSVHHSDMLPYYSGESIYILFILYYFHCEYACLFICSCSSFLVTDFPKSAWSCSSVCALTNDSFKPNLSHSSSV